MWLWVAAPVVRFDTDLGPITVEVEVMRTPQERALGMMHRKELAANKGMLFIFPRADVQAFWMKNTLIALDMIFIDEARRVVGVVHDAEPLTLQSRGVDKASKYVVEVNGGFATEHQIRIGTFASVPDG